MGSLGERIRLVRSSGSKCSQEKFASMTGISRPMLATYELDKVIPSDSYLMLISKTFGINYQWLKTGEGQMSFPVPENPIGVLASTYVDADDRLKHLIEIVASLSSDDWHKLMDVIDILSDRYKK